MSGALSLAFVVAAFALVASVLAVAAARRERGQAARSAPRAAIALVPAFGGIWIALSVVGPGLWGNEDAPFHEHHLGLAHPGFSWVLGGAMLLATVALVRAAREALRLGRQVAESRRWAARIRTFPEERVDGATVHVVPGLGVGAVTTFGIIAVGEELWRQLDDSARRAVALHENAHVLRRDWLTLIALRALAAWLPRRASDRLVAAWRTAAELECDHYAAATIGDETEVARALVACGRLQNLRCGGGEPVFAGSGAVAFGIADDVDDIELRVRSLLDRPAERRRPVNDLGVALTPLFVLVVAALCASGAHLHRFAEALLATSF